MPICPSAFTIRPTGNLRRDELPSLEDRVAKLEAAMHDRAGETLALQTLCAALLTELALTRPDPPTALATISETLSGTLSGAMQDGKLRSPVSVAVTSEVTKALDMADAMLRKRLRGD
ncbi:hypothetical protein [Roseomonas indoligenes]|uniref:Uncharacterized protein n=1 Tax=Roseomonas indoligenes TaxID=2820811 RepID=A0A940MXX9_9PROT|nr:hypothetical protein [Pararoseomonas indoligenes]MBP0493050.1 hypothetical protein [Pararoseomonas indoligenes]